MTHPESKLTRYLVAWYGLYQFIHVGVNTRGLTQLTGGGIDFLALLPSEGWSSQAVHFFTAMAALDLLNAVLSIVFVAGFFRGGALAMVTGNPDPGSLHLRRLGVRLHHPGQQHLVRGQPAWLCVYQPHFSDGGLLVGDVHLGYTGEI